jgi:DNA-binding MarR family transcriptional regulator
MPSDLEVVLAALSRIFSTCRPRVVAVSSGVSATPHQLRLLTYLDRDDPTMVTELAETTGVTPSTMSLTLARLERAGLVVRERDPDDRRVMNVRLTDAGERAREAAGPLDPESVDRALYRLDPEERREVARALSLLAEAADGPPR